MAEPDISPELIKELATAAIAKRKQDTKKAASTKRVRPFRLPERALLELTRSLSNFYGYKAEPHTNKEHRLMAEIVAETWVPLLEYEHQVQAKDEALERIEELNKEVADLRARIEHRIQEVPRLKAVIRAAVARLIVDTSEKHVKEEWALVLLKRIEAARDILNSESAPGVDGKA